MRKDDEIANPSSCLNRSHGDEPLFVLCARDELAVEVVQFWAHLAKMRGVNESKVKDALALADMMKAWPTKKLPS